MTEHTAHRYKYHFETRIPELVERVVHKASRFAESAARDTERLERRIQHAAEKARRQAERAEERADRLQKKIQLRIEKGESPRVKDELCSVVLEIERQALAAVETALREVEQHLSEIDVEAIVKRVEDELSKIDTGRIGREVQEAMREASTQVRVELKRHGFVASEDDAKIRSEPVSDEERMAVLRMVQNGTITAEEAAMLLDSLEGRAG
jgi:hypothetical protein